MATRWSRWGGHEWATRFEAERVCHEDRLAQVTGQPTLVWCDSGNDELVVEVVNLHPAHLEVVADELCGLWPGFLAPAGVSLRVVDGDVWDNESMALRSFRLRHGDD